MFLTSAVEKVSFNSLIIDHCEKNALNDKKSAPPGVTGKGGKVVRGAWAVSEHVEWRPVLTLDRCQIAILCTTGVPLSKRLPLPQDRMQTARLQLYE